MRIAVVGFGSMGRNHFRVLRDMPGVEVCAVCDPALSEDVGVPRYDNVRDLVRADLGLDAAIVATPTSCHRETSLALIRQGISVLIEKPLAATVCEATDIKRAADTAGVKAAVGQIERFNPVVEQLIREVQGKRMFSIHITRVGPFPPRIADVGVLVDLSVHDVDLVRYITGKRPILESRVFQSSNSGIAHEDNAVIAFKLSDDVVASITTNWLTPFKKRTIEVATDEGYYEGNLITQELVEYSSYKADSSYVVRHCQVRRAEPLRRELDAFVKYLSSGDLSDLASIDDGLETLAIIGRRRNHAVAV